MNFRASLVFTFFIFYKELVVKVNGGLFRSTSSTSSANRVSQNYDNSDSMVFSIVRQYRPPISTEYLPGVSQIADDVSGTVVLSMSAAFTSQNSLFWADPSQKVNLVSGEVEIYTPDQVSKEYLNNAFKKNLYRQVSPKLVGLPELNGAMDFGVDQVSNKISGRATLQNKVVIECPTNQSLPKSPYFLQVANSVSGETKQRLAVVIACKHFCRQPIFVKQLSQKSSGTVSQEMIFFYDCPKGVTPKLILNQITKRKAKNQSVLVFVKDD